MSHGLRVTPNAEFSVELPIANSSMFNRPKTIAPAAFNFSIDRRVVGRNEFAENFRAAIQRLVFDGEHVLDGDGHAEQRAVARAAPPEQRFVRRVRLRERVAASWLMKAWICPSTRSIWSRQAWMTSRAETSRWASLAVSSEMVS